MYPSVHPCPLVAASRETWCRAEMPACHPCAWCMYSVVLGMDGCLCLISECWSGKTAVGAQDAGRRPHERGLLTNRRLQAWQIRLAMFQCALAGKVVARCRRNWRFSPVALSSGVPATHWGSLDFRLISASTAPLSRFDGELSCLPACGAELPEFNRIPCCGGGSCGRQYGYRRSRWRRKGLNS
jgi:hypothetical protein